MLKTFDKDFVNEYYDLIYTEFGEDDDLQGYDIEEPTQDVVARMTGIFFNNIRGYAETFVTQTYQEHITSENTNDDDLRKEVQKTYLDTIKDVYISIFEDVTIYHLLYPSKEGEELINYIIGQSIETCIENMSNDIDFAHTIIDSYLRYLVKRSQFIISDNQEKALWDDTPILRCIIDNKGYSTISDIAREILMDLYYDYSQNYPEDDRMYLIYDQLFTGSSKDIYLLQNGIDTNNLEQVKLVKSQMFRVMMQDAYIDLKTMEFSQLNPEYMGDYMTDEEMQTVDFLENEDNQFEIPKDKEIRYTIYSHFFYYNDEDNYMDRKSDMKKMGENEKRHITRMNPIYFLD